MKKLLSFLLLLAVAAAQPAPKLYPVDEGPQDPGFQAFRRRLLEALRRHDKDFVMGLLDPAVKVSFGPDDGPQGFAEHWGLDRPASSRLWTELTTILSLGGRLQRDGDRTEFCAPYISTHFPDGWDPLEYAAIVASNVIVRSRPAPSAPAIARLSFDIVRTEAPASETQAWMKIVTPDGHPGYVARRYVRSPIDYRACFLKQESGRWVLRLLVAGD